jgi:hypothetical protein
MTRDADGHISDRSLSVMSLGVAGVLGANVDGFEGAAGASHELLDLELGIGQERGASLVERDAPFVEGDRAFERLAAGLELGDGLLELDQGVVEGQVGDGGLDALGLVGHGCGSYPPR